MDKTKNGAMRHLLISDAAVCLEAEIYIGVVMDSMNLVIYCHIRVVHFQGGP